MDLNGSLFDAINDLAGHITLVDDVMKFAAQYVVFVVFAIVLLSWFVHRGSDESRRLGVYTAGATALLSLLGVLVIQHFYTHARPFVERDDVVKLISHGNDSSFPSDHATVAFAMAAGVAVYRGRIGAALVALATLVAFARVYVGVHYPADVLAGAAIGLGLALVLRLARPAFAWLDQSLVLRVVPAVLR